jgi:hypothetical protein
MSVRQILADAFGLPPTASEDEVAQAWADDIIATQRTSQGLSEPPQVTGGASVDDPQAEFERMAELWAKTHGVSLAEGYSRVSQEAPTLYERATAKARLN